MESNIKDLSSPTAAYTVFDNVSIALSYTALNETMAIAMEVLYAPNTTDNISKYAASSLSKLYGELRSHYHNVDSATVLAYKSEYAAYMIGFAEATMRNYIRLRAYYPGYTGLGQLIKAFVNYASYLDSLNEDDAPFAMPELFHPEDLKRETSEDGSVDTSCVGVPPYMKIIHTLSRLSDGARFNSSVLHHKKTLCMEATLRKLANEIWRAIGLVEETYYFHYIEKRGILIT